MEKCPRIERMNISWPMSCSNQISSHLIESLAPLRAIKRVEMLLQEEQVVVIILFKSHK